MRRGAEDMAFINVRFDIVLVLTSSDYLKAVVNYKICFLFSLSLLGYCYIYVYKKEHSKPYFGPYSKVSEALILNDVLTYLTYRSQIWALALGYDLSKLIVIQAAV